MINEDFIKDWYLDQAVRASARNTIFHFKHRRLKDVPVDERVFAFHSKDFPDLVEMLLEQKFAYEKLDLGGVDYDWVIRFQDLQGPSFMYLKYSEQIVI